MVAILLTPYIVLALKFGNVQSLLVTLIFMAFLWVRAAPGGPVWLCRWRFVSSPVYMYAVISSWRARAERRHVWDAASFVFYSALQTFGMHSGLISLWPAILMAGHVYSNPSEYGERPRRALLIACGLSIVGSMTFYRPVQRDDDAGNSFLDDIGAGGIAGAGRQAAVALFGAEWWWTGLASSC